MTCFCVWSMVWGSTPPKFQQYYFNFLYSHWFQSFSWLPLTHRLGFKTKPYFQHCDSNSTKEIKLQTPCIWCDTHTENVETEVHRRCSSHTLPRGPHSLDHDSKSSVFLFHCSEQLAELQTCWWTDTWIVHEWNMKGNNNNPSFCVLIRQKSQRVLLTAALISPCLSFLNLWNVMFLI